MHALHVCMHMAMCVLSNGNDALEFRENDGQNLQQQTESVWIFASQAHRSELHSFNVNAREKENERVQNRARCAFRLRRHY